MLTYVIYLWVPAMDSPGFARARGQGVIEQFDDLRKSNDGTKVILKWRGEQPAELVPGLILWTGTHSQILQKLIDDSDEWTSLP